MPWLLTSSPWSSVFRDGHLERHVRSVEDLEGRVLAMTQTPSRRASDNKASLSRGAIAGFIRHRQRYVPGPFRIYEDLRYHSPASERTDRQSERQVSEVVHQGLAELTMPGNHRMVPVIRECQSRRFEYLIIHSKQHCSERIDGIAFSELDLPAPKYNLNVGSGGHANEEYK